VRVRLLLLFNSSGEQDTALPVTPVLQPASGTIGSGAIGSGTIAGLDVEERLARSARRSSRAASSPGARRRCSRSSRRACTASSRRITSSPGARCPSQPRPGFTA